MIIELLMIPIIFIVLGVAIAVTDYFEDCYFEKLMRRELELIAFETGLLGNEEAKDNLSVSEYLERMEKLHLELHRNNETEKARSLTLWWGYDGLLINSDGTTKWISRKPEEKELEKHYNPYSMLNNQQYMQSGCYTPCEQGIISGIANLNNNLAVSQLNLFSQMCNQSMVSTEDFISAIYRIRGYMD